MNDFYTADIAGLKRNLPLFPLNANLRVALLNLLGDTELLTHVSGQLLRLLKIDQVDTFVAPATKGIVLGYELARQSGKNWVILQKSQNFYAGKSISAQRETPLTKREKKLYLYEQDRHFIENKQIVLVDDVFTSGTTLEMMQDIVEEAGGTVLSRAVVCVEGDLTTRHDILSLTHLPFFPNDLAARVARATDGGT